VPVPGLTQTVGDASGTCRPATLPATVAVPMARSLDISASTIYLALSFALLLQFIGGPWIGMVVDRWRGRTLPSRRWRSR
jgi:hypothetical protein